MATPITISGRSVGKWRGSWLLFKETFRFLLADKEMVLIPLITGFLNLFFLGMVIAGYFLAGGFATLMGTGAVEQSLRLVDYGFIFLIYVMGAYTLALSQAAIAFTVFTRAHGGNPTLGQSLVVAFGHTRSLLGWALVTSTVGLVLRFIGERSRLVGRTIESLLGAAWNLLTFFAVPSIVLGNKSFYGAIGHSAYLFRRTWGELLVSNITLGLTFFLAYVLALLSFMGLLALSFAVGSITLFVIAVTMAIVWFVAAALVQTALQAVLKTLLYLYAAEGTLPKNFNHELLEAVLARQGAVSLPPAPADPRAPLRS